MKPRTSDYSKHFGQRFGLLVMLSEVPTHPNEVRKCLCECDCGRRKTFNIQNVLRGMSTSCGCERTRRSVASRRKHGACLTPEFRAWTSMKTRCANPKCVMYPNYGGRGVTVCERWSDFRNFLADMGEKPAPEYTLERINVNGNYEPGNCRWATQREQSRNHRNTVYLEYSGERLPLVEWAERLGIQRGTLAYRLKKGWSPAAIIETPVGGKR